jgi:hypothetical protein
VVITTRDVSEFTCRQDHLLYRVIASQAGYEMCSKSYSRTREVIGTHADQIRDAISNQLREEDL